ncbi:hypothetical protein [Bacillus sp. 7884-1]|uniref:hypothetical protein n=1 Tax=Bacillus sp. 7884-1 TaxID=2021693 RepID=UPI000BA5C0D7|nr:hypothetical protein [Bacillus sp. 7884-1]PAE32287.1 hypothetical protein CHI06_26935 [Bacillus sp. 7884-1]
MFIISTLVLIIFTIILGMYINKRIKKKKKVGKQFLLGFLVWVAFLSYYNVNPAHEVADAKEVEEKKDKPVEIKEKPVDPTASYLKTLQEGLAGGYTVTYNKDLKAFEITPVDKEAFNHMLYQIEQQADVESIRQWNHITYSLEDMSETTKGYQIVFVNPMNTDNFLLIASDGKITYNFLNELMGL